MSFMLFSKNRIEVKNTSTLESDFIEKLKKYFEDISNFEGLRRYNIYNISIKNNDEVYRLGDDGEVSEIQFKSIIKRINNKENLLIEAYYELEINYMDASFNHKGYGNEFFSNVLTDELRNNVRVYSIDRVDNEEGFSTLRFDENGLNTRLNIGNIEDFKKINRWFTPKFVVSIDKQKMNEDEKGCSRVIEILKSYKIEDSSVLEIDDDEIFFEGELCLDELNGLNNNINEIKEITNRNNATCSITLDIEAYEEGKFATLSLKNDENSIVFETYGPYEFNILK